MSEFLRKQEAVIPASLEVQEQQRLEVFDQCIERFEPTIKRLAVRNWQQAQHESFGRTWWRIPIINNQTRSSATVDITPFSRDDRLTATDRSVVDIYAYTGQNGVLLSGLHVLYPSAPEDDSEHPCEFRLYSVSQQQIDTLPQIS